MINNLSSIHPGARLAPGVVVDPFVTIEDNVEIGEGTRIHSNAVIKSGSRIGRNCQIMSGAVVGGIPQDLKFRGENRRRQYCNTRVRDNQPWHGGKG